MSTPAERALAHVRGRTTGTTAPGAPITVNFHPYRVLADGRTVAAHLAADGVYRTQFETGISNGGVGGSRPVHTFDGVWESLLVSVSATGRALGLTASSPAEWVAALGTPRTAPGRAMDDYVEAHIHGGLTLRDDVTAVVADPSFLGTDTEALLRALGPPLRWAPGFRLPAADFPAGLRGPAVPPLALALGAPVIDAAVIGRAAQSAVRDPGDWARFGDPADVLQLLKYVWHILVLLGEPAC